MGSHGLQCVICDRLEWGSCLDEKICDGCFIFVVALERQKTGEEPLFTPGELCSRGGPHLGETRAPLQHTLYVLWYMM